MKIGLPKLRLSRKLLIITLGVTVLLGGTGVTALYFSGKTLVMEGGENAVGGECTDIQTMVIKTPSNHLWLRRFIRMEKGTGQERVRTALRIAGLIAKKNAVDLIHVSVLDAHGPDKRADMRARAIGAEVLIALKPENLPEMKAPALASYYEGPVSDDGHFYGDKVIVDLDEIRAMMTAMRTVEEKPDCTVPESEVKAEDAAKKNDHGKKDKKEGHETSSESKPENTHGEQPETKHGETEAKTEGEKPAEDGKKADHAAAEAPAKEQSFVDGMLSMVGLGSSEPAATEEHTAKEPAEAPAEEKKNAEGEAPAKEESMVDGMLNMIGLGPSESHDAAKEVDPAEKALGIEPEASNHDAPAEDHADTPAAAEDHAAEKPAKDGHATAEEKPEASSHDDAPAEDAAKADSHDAIADDHASSEAAAEDHTGNMPTDAAEQDPTADKAAAAAHDTAPAEDASSTKGHDAAAEEHPAEKPAADHSDPAMPVGD